MFLRLNRQRRGPCHPVAKRYIIFPLCAGSLKASSLPFVVLASKSAVVHSQNGPRDPVLERYEIHRATPESPRSQKMCIALVLRTVVSNKYGELPILIPLLAFFFFFFGLRLSPFGGEILALQPSPMVQLHQLHLFSQKKMAFSSSPKP